MAKFSRSTFKQTGSLVVTRRMTVYGPLRVRAEHGLGGDRIGGCMGDDELRGHTPPIEAVAARLAYLPPYSPDFNPIEQVFAKLK
jgi:hypothetical protein